MHFLPQSYFEIKKTNESVLCNTTFQIKENSKKFLINIKSFSSDETNVYIFISSEKDNNKNDNQIKKFNELNLKKKKLIIKWWLQQNEYSKDYINNTTFYKEMFKDDILNYIKTKTNILDKMKNMKIIDCNEFIKVRELLSNLDKNKIKYFDISIDKSINGIDVEKIKNNNEIINEIKLNNKINKKTKNSIIQNQSEKNENLLDFNNSEDYNLNKKFFFDEILNNVNYSEYNNNKSIKLKSFIDESDKELQIQYNKLFNNISILLLNIDFINECDSNVIVSIDGVFKTFCQYYKRKSKFDYSNIDKEENKKERSSRKVKFAIYPLASTDNKATYYIFGYIISVKMNSEILKNGLTKMYDIIKEQHPNMKNPPIISCDNGAVEVSTCNQLGFFYIICRFHLIKDFLTHLKKTSQKKNNIIDHYVEILDVLDEKNLDENKKILMFLEQIEFENENKYDKNYEYSKNEKKKGKKNKKKKNKDSDDEKNEDEEKIKKEKDIYEDNSEDENDEPNETEKKKINKIFLEKLKVFGMDLEKNENFSNSDLKEFGEIINYLNKDFSYIYILIYSILNSYSEINYEKNYSNLKKFIESKSNEYPDLKNFMKYFDKYYHKIHLHITNQNRKSYLFLWGTANLTENAIKIISNEIRSNHINSTHNFYYLVEYLIKDGFKKIPFNFSKSKVFKKIKENYTNGLINFKQINFKYILIPIEFQKFIKDLFQIEKIKNKLKYPENYFFYDGDSFVFKDEKNENNIIFLIKNNFIKVYNFRILLRLFKFYFFEDSYGKIMLELIFKSIFKIKSFSSNEYYKILFQFQNCSCGYSIVSGSKPCKHIFGFIIFFINLFSYNNLINNINNGYYNKKKPPNALTLISDFLMEIVKKDFKDFENLNILNSFSIKEIEKNPSLNKQYVKDLRKHKSSNNDNNKIEFIIRSCESIEFDENYNIKKVFCYFSPESQYKDSSEVIVDDIMEFLIDLFIIIIKKKEDLKNDVVQVDDEETLILKKINFLECKNFLDFNDFLKNYDYEKINFIFLKEGIITNKNISEVKLSVLKIIMDFIKNSMKKISKGENENNCSLNESIEININDNNDSSDIQRQLNESSNSIIINQIDDNEGKSIDSNTELINEFEDEEEEEYKKTPPSPKIIHRNKKRKII